MSPIFYNLQAQNGFLKLMMCEQNELGGKLTVRYCQFCDQGMVRKTNYTIIARPYRALNTKSLAMINLNMGLHHLTSSTGTPFSFFQNLNILHEALKVIWSFSIFNTLFLEHFLYEKIIVTFVHNPNFYKRL